MCVGTFALPIDFELTGEKVHDLKIAPGFIDKLPPGDYLIADKGRGFNFEVQRSMKFWF